MSRIRFGSMPGQSVLGYAITPCVVVPAERWAIMVFFGNVNQVLVRLWARVSGLW
jgi:hypothetical protein